MKVYTNPKDVNEQILKNLGDYELPKNGVCKITNYTEKVKNIVPDPIHMERIPGFFHAVIDTITNTISVNETCIKPTIYKEFDICKFENRALPNKLCLSNNSEEIDNCLNAFEKSYWVRESTDKWYQQVCEINMEKLNNPFQLVEYLEKFGGSQETTDIIFDKICRFKVEDYNFCPNYSNGYERQNCMLLVAEDNQGLGDMCRKWAAKKTAAERDLLKTKYCKENPDSDDCHCINRSSDKDFMKLLETTDQPNNVSHCWYKPCDSFSGNLTLELNPPCEITNCEILYKVINSKNISIDSKNTINCKKLLQNKITTPISNKKYQPEKIPKDPPVENHPMAKRPTFRFLKKTEENLLKFFQIVEKHPYISAITIILVLTVIFMINHKKSEENN
jgi:hypothetical protein